MADDEDEVVDHAAERARLVALGAGVRTNQCSERQLDFVTYDVHD